MNICRTKRPEPRKFFQNFQKLEALIHIFPSKFQSNSTRLIPKLFPGHVLGDLTFRLTSFVSQSPGTIADQWESEDLDRTTKTSDIGRKEFWYQPRTTLQTEGEGNQYWLRRNLHVWIIICCSSSVTTSLFPTLGHEHRRSNTNTHTHTHTPNNNKKTTETVHSKCF